MPRPPRRIGLLTGGGDCPGLNAVIRAVVKDACFNGFEVVGIEDGFLGLIEDRTRALTPEHVTSILTVGGTILGSSNKANPLRHAVARGPDGLPILGDVTGDCLAHVQKHGIDTLVIIGGDGTMTIAAEFARLGVPVLGIPKTIDNDLYGTDLTFGFQTAVSTATDALDKVRTTAASHHRAIVVEVMGRNAGWIALHAGIAGGADAILIPEIPFSFQAVARMVEERTRRGKRYSVLCVAEGASPVGGHQVVARLDPTSPDPVRLGGIGKQVADRLEELTGVESRYVVLGHVQRGGTPIASDRVLGTQLGHHAMVLLRGGRVAPSAPGPAGLTGSRMVAIHDSHLTDVPIEEPAGRQRLVPANHPLIAAARAVYSGFGDDA